METGFDGEEKEAGEEAYMCSEDEEVRSGRNASLLGVFWLSIHINVGGGDLMTPT